MARTERFPIVALAFALVAVLGGCTDTTEALRDANDRPLRIMCYSGGQPILDDYTVESAIWHDVGISYRSQTTNRMIRVAADCVTMDLPMPAGWKAMLPGQTR